MACTIGYAHERQETKCVLGLAWIVYGNVTHYIDEVDTLDDVDTDDDIDTKREVQ